MQHSTLPCNNVLPSSLTILQALQSMKSTWGHYGLYWPGDPPKCTTVQWLSMPEWNPPCWCVAQPWWVTYERCQNYNCHLNILKSDLISGANQHHHQWSRLILNIHNIELGPFITPSLAMETISRVGGWYDLTTGCWLESINVVRSHGDTR